MNGKAAAKASVLIGVVFMGCDFSCFVISTRPSTIEAEQIQGLLPVGSEDRVIEPLGYHQPRWCVESRVGFRVIQRVCQYPRSFRQIGNTHKDVYSANPDWISGLLRMLRLCRGAGSQGFGGEDYPCLKEIAPTQQVNTLIFTTPYQLVQSVVFIPFKSTALHIFMRIAAAR